MPITFAQFNTKLSGGKSYPRLFSFIKSISLSANSSQIKEIKHFFKLNDFRNRDKKSINNSFTVFYEQNNSQLPLKLNRIQITLLTKQPQRNIFISNALTILVDGEEATFLFK